MNCRDIAELAPLYLSGELRGSERDLFASHLAGCRSCASEMERQSAMDARVREALSEMPDASDVQSAVRVRIGGRRRGWWQVGAAAAAVVAVLGLVQFGIMRASPATRIVADAAQDHRAEVIEHQPRRWRTNAAEIASLAARYGLADVSVLTPPGYSLEHAKMCGLDRQPALHLVFTNGSQEMSVYVRARVWKQNGVHAGGSGSNYTASFQNDRFAVIATGDSSVECFQFANAMAQVL
jgi:anti-sigma factor RsiW